MAQHMAPQHPLGLLRRPLARRLLAAASVGAATALILAGCTAGTPTDGSSGALSEDSIASIAAYTGSTPGKADSSLEPVTWGYVNQEGGAQDYSFYTSQTTALVDIVNNQLGGIGGHPLKLDVCHVVSSDEEGQTCGQQFANNPDITAIIQFPLINGNATFHKVIDPLDIPLFSPVPGGQSDSSGPGFYMAGSNISAIPILVGYTAGTLKAKNVALIAVEGNAISQMVAGAIKGALEGAGATVKQGNVSATSSDVTAPLVAAGVTDADAVIALLPTASQCASVFNALGSLGAKAPVVSIAQCATEDVKSALGDYPTWTFIAGYPNAGATPLDDREAAEVAVAVDLNKVLGAPKSEVLDAEQTLQTFLTALASVNTAGGADATKATISKAAAAFTGPLWAGPDEVAWGVIPGSPSVYTLSQRLYTYVGDDKWEDAGNGWFEVVGGPPAGAPPGGAAPTPAP